MITVRIDNTTRKTKPYKTSRFGAYEYAWVRLDGWWYKVRRRLGNPFFVFYSALPNLDKHFGIRN